MKKKVGILTFHNADNLGAVLQAYALQKAIKDECGSSVDIIDYVCSQVEETKKAKKCRTLKDFIKFIPMSLYYCIKHSGFEKFRKKRLNLSDKTYTQNTVKSSVNNYDLFITGSDQVWNLECSGNDMTYFLDFVPDSKLKYSYAASIGEYTYSSDETAKVVDLLKRFNAVSVREESALSMLNSFGLTDINVHPDPVILLSMDKWQSIMSGRLYKQKYVLVYLIQDDVNVVKSAEAYAKANNCRIIHNKESIEFILHNSPEEFLSWVYYSDCVFTNSFHGTAFSVIMNKHLAADIELKRGGINERIHGLLTSINADHCIITSDNPFGGIPNAEDILRNMRTLACKHLKSICME